jgi:hypothetical protein
MSADIIKLILAVQNWFMKCEGCSIIDFYNGPYQEDVKLCVGGQHKRTWALTELGLNIYLIKSLTHLWQEVGISKETTSNITKQN